MYHRTGHFTLFSLPFTLRQIQIGNIGTGNTSTLATLLQRFQRMRVEKEVDKADVANTVIVAIGG